MATDVRNAGRCTVCPGPGSYAARNAKASSKPEGDCRERCAQCKGQQRTRSHGLWSMPGLQQRRTRGGGVYIIIRCIYTIMSYVGIKTHMHILYYVIICYIFNIVNNVHIALPFCMITVQRVRARLVDPCDTRLCELCTAYILQYLSLHLCIYIERERQREREREIERRIYLSLYVYVCICMYIYIYIYTEREREDR